MISLRFFNDGKPILSLTDIQIRIKKIIEKKIKDGTYFFETVDCIVCNSNNFESLSGKDRYGLFMPVKICKQCGLVQTNPRMKESHYLEFYESEYRKLYSSNETLHLFFEHQYEQGKNIYNFIKKSTKNNHITGKFVIEIGSGSGGILKYFQDKGNNVLGFDLDEEFLDFGKKKGVNLKKGTIENLSTLSQYPDIVIYSHVLEHLNDPIKELKILRKFLKNDSILYIEVPGILNIHRTPSYQDFLKYLQNVHLYHFCLNSLHNILQKSGFKLILGTEGCNAVYVKGDYSDDFTNEYEKTLSYLLDLESSHLNKFSKNNLKYSLFSVILKFLYKTKTISIVKFFNDKINNVK